MNWVWEVCKGIRQGLTFTPDQNTSMPVPSKTTALIERTLIEPDEHKNIPRWTSLPET
jgi:hypothetical protein